MVEGLVREFVSQGLGTDLDFTGLQRVNPKFHSGRRSARRREGDVIWRLPTHQGSDIYLYLLIEFQSKCDRWMAVRSQVYQGLLWQQVIDEQTSRAGVRLPPLLTLVLYNGEPHWQAAGTTGELIAILPDSALWHWQPQARYHVFDMGAYPKDELARRSSLVSFLFRLEQRHSDEELRELVDEVSDWFQRHAGYERLQGLFTELIHDAHVVCGVELSGPNNLLKEKGMLATSIRAWKEQWCAEVEAELKAAGKAEGRAEEKVTSLLCLLSGRFGKVEPSWEKRIREAELATLDLWFKRAIVAPDLPSVFDPAAVGAASEHVRFQQSQS